SHGAAAGIAQLQQLHRALQGAVFAVAAMQGDEHAIEARGRQLAQRMRAGIEQMRIDAGRLQRLVHALAGHQRHFALGGTAAVQDTHLAQRLHIDGRFHGLIHASSPTWAGTLLIDPAPMTTTTSPSRTKSRMACGSSATSSTKTGSIRPATRSARASARPSAATSGGSPAE